MEMPDRPTVWEKYKVLHSTLIELLRKTPSDDQEGENKFRQTVKCIGEVVLVGMGSTQYNVTPEKFTQGQDQGHN